MSINQELIGLATAVLAAALPFARAYVQSHFNTTKLLHVADLARTAVQAAEQLGTDALQPSNASKLNFASDMLVSTAKRLGVKLTTDEVLGFVHSALRDMKVADETVRRGGATLAA